MISKSSVHPDYEIKTNNGQADLSYFNKQDRQLPKVAPINEVNSVLSDLNTPYASWFKQFVLLATKLKTLPDAGYWQSHAYETLIDDSKKGIVYLDDLSCDVPDYLAMDTETTGLSPQSDYVIQFSIVQYHDHKEIDHYDCYLKPANNMAVPQVITNITGITNDEIQKAPKFDRNVAEIEDWLTRGILVGHNLQFDLDMLKAEYQRINCPFPSVEYYDTLLLAKKLIPNLGYGGYKLENLKKQLPEKAIATLKSHDSLNDSRMTGALFEYLQELGRRK